MVPTTSENFIPWADVYYRSTYKGSKALDALIAMEDLGLDRKRYKPTELKKKLKELLK